MAPTCYTCKTTFQVNSHMVSHCRVTGHVRGWVCGNCDKPFQDEEARRQHVQAKHPQGKRPFMCSHCNESFRSEEARKKHTEAKHQFQCSYCKDNFNSADSLKQHNFTDHYFPCEFNDCDSVFNTEQLLNNHKGNKHKFRCNKCNKDFQSQGPLDKHDTEFHRSFRCKSYLSKM
ncbi:similar to transcription factor Zn, C2H2 [Botrytis cinerea T4]|uniref:Similar to transcription factor Zn, C2H2 n=1 Tax=Botryotinia fuckeliana (strain T4) TaxID=999810 RepID=G2YLR7_BOTF4|nr:similar to transcription factor Zn, C2H2 [Botrytis cinerea T4]